jgi:xanthine/uracil/vitamin C permease (AzgA family)
MQSLASVPPRLFLVGVLGLVLSLIFMTAKADGSVRLSIWSLTDTSMIPDGGD